MSRDDWRTRIDDITAAVEKVRRYVEGMDFAGFCNDDRTVDAVIRNLSVIGEAASRVPPDVITRYPGIPWALMRGIRNVLVHEYFGVSLQVIWDTANEDLPPLAEQLRRVLDENP
ncbi:MAG: DUF86 domain-containing protein [Deltaproteobacteria bacterium]|nr:DUF86 domain-containing protein [Deltaproteobacteria bacterium]